METQFKQSREMRGSFINSLMGNNSSVPRVGEGATVCLWSDRHAYEVIEVSTDLKKVKIQRYRPKRIDDLGMTDSGQTYEYKELTEEVLDIVWYRGKWRKLDKCIEFTKEFQEKAEEGIYGKTYYSGSKYLQDTDPDMYLELYANGASPFPVKVIEGVTRVAKSYSPVSILWGTKDEYYDFSF